MSGRTSSLVDAAGHLQSAVQAYVAARADDRMAIDHLARVRALIAQADTALNASDAAQVRRCLSDIQGVVDALAERKQVASANFEVIARSLSQMKGCLTIHRPGGSQELQ